MEVEVKIAVESLEPYERRAEALQYTVRRPFHFEANTLFDFPERALLHTGCLLRVRETPAGGVLTFKGKVVQHDHYKVRPEHETPCADPAAMREILQSLGLTAFFRYEKYREEYRAEGAVLCLDELPFGAFLELEGSPEGIEALAAALALDRAAFNKRSYADLYAENCRKEGKPFGDIVFGRGGDGCP